MFKPRFVALFFLVLLASLAPLIQPVFFPSPEQLVSQLPILQGGRVKPLDTLSRTALLGMRGKQTVVVAKKTLSSQSWILDTLYRPEKADTYSVFRIDDPAILGIMSLESGKKKYFSFNELRPYFTVFELQSTQADALPARDRSSFQRNILRLRNAVLVYNQLKNTLSLEGFPNFIDHAEGTLKLSVLVAPVLKTGSHGKMGVTENGVLRLMLEDFKAYKWMSSNGAFYAISPSPLTGGKWVTFGDALILAMGGQPHHPDLDTLLEVGKTYQANHPQLMPCIVAKVTVPSRVMTEWLYNFWSPFYTCIILYLLAALGVFLSWLLNRKSWGPYLTTLLFSTFIIHTVGIVLRMWIQGRPPVTNLYTSAVFVGWVAIALGMILERVNRNGVGSLVSGLIGFTTLIIAHHLSLQGDTLEMMQAVLDSNFWLSTHVVTVTMGYGATFLAGFLAHVAIFRRSHRDEILKMVFGTLCFALFFSFLGTVLGGIWADQSWGRFWGWDPKENGALMIVLWNAAILHARLAGMIKARGLLVMAVFGNIITAFSWFGVNMLGVGLHSYGFMDQAFFWLVVFVFVEILVIWWAFFPEKKSI